MKNKVIRIIFDDDVTDGQVEAAVHMVTIVLDTLQITAVQFVEEEDDDEGETSDEL